MREFKRWIKVRRDQKPLTGICAMLNSNEKWNSVGKVGGVTKTGAQRRFEEIRRKIRMVICEFEDANATLETLE